MARPRSTSLEGRLLNQQSTVDPARLQIRVVPYSPPRLSSDGSVSSRPVSYADCSLSPPFSDQNRATDSDHDIGDSRCLVVESSHQNSTSCETPRGTENETINVVEDDASSAVNWTTTSPTSIPASPTPSYRRPRRTITVNSDKTFSLLPQSQYSSATESLRSPRRSSTAPSSSADRTISETFAEDHQPSSPLTPLQEISRPPSSYCSHSPPASPIAETSSPWNYTLTGGVRKVPSSANKTKVEELPNAAISTGPSLQTAFATSGSSGIDFAAPGTLTTKQSFHSSHSNSTWSERSNYKTFVSESPCPDIGRYLQTADDVNPDSILPSSSHSNFEIIGESSSERSLDDRSRSETNGSDLNYVLHQDFPSSPPDGLASGSALRTEYSRESLVVAPLRPAKRFFSDQTNLSTQKSRDSIRTGSLTSISSVFIEEAARSLFAGSAVISSRGGAFRKASSRRNNSIGLGNRRMNSSHHQWGATLSPVLSESDRGSAVPSLAFSQSTAGDQRRPSNFSGLNTPGLSPDVSRHDIETWMDLPPPSAYRVWSRDVNNSSLRLIRDQDEHGDGLAELEELHRRPSRTRLHSYLSNFPSDRNLRSSGSSRSNSFSRSHIPTWAKLYYGSGERRFLTIQHSSDSLFSEFNASVHNSPLISRSPSIECFNSAIQFPRHRPLGPPPDPAASPARDPTPGPAPSSRPRVSEAAADDPVSYPPLNLVRRVKKQTSSIWSPHLRRDRRSHRYSLWRPPSTVWVREEHSSRRNNIQPILFVLGFVLPFAWMFASFLPLPPPSQADMKEKNHLTRHLDLESGRRYSTKGQNSSSHYNKARWWRNLNRYMSVIGLFLIGAAIALTVTGTQQWKP